ncbi:FAD-binding domain-containing protein [Mycena indigotica]|uniref:FAD-binding domain-containing protein n=1 Tax=Mycena indigotica TaxID=2126181 RepID=A0A8H6SEJ5_9AGAR|nr:FAD-binding domain-containing protein [Mycena indigotica]KAF7297488.1 FAD-binding domain-containing protein [Mycena indigotica]
MTLLPVLFLSAASALASSLPSNSSSSLIPSSSSLLSLPRPSADSLSSPASAARSACQSISKSLGNAVVLSSGTSEYNFTQHNAWNFQNTLFAPTCIVYPRNAGHVQTAMRAIFKAKSRYAVQSGSHSAVKGWNTVQDGVLISFSHMQAVSYDAKAQSVTIEPGVHWGAATDQLSAQGVAVVGGRVGDVGTGLLLGGGVSFLSPAEGWAADNFLSVDIVLVDGTLVTATGTNKYSDLFKALKGGANRFGIATKYTVRAVNVGTKQDTPFFGGVTIFDGSAAPALAKATAKYTRTVTDSKASLLTTISTTITNGTVQQVCVLFMFYRGTSLPQSIFGDFLAIPSLQQSLTPLTWTQILPQTDPPQFVSSARGFVQHVSSSALTLPPASSGPAAPADPAGDALVQDALTHYLNYTATFINAKSKSGMGNAALTLTPVLASQLAAGRAKGGNVMVSPDLKHPFLMVQLSEQFLPGVSDIPPFVQAGMDLFLKQVPASKGLPLFINECDKKQEVFKSYAGYEFLKETYRKYDPTRFNVQFTDGPSGL